jgi:hypothetical protein
VWVIFEVLGVCVCVCIWQSWACSIDMHDD